MTELSAFPLPRSFHGVAGPLVVAVLLVATPAVAPGQEEAPDRPEAEPEDVESIEAIVAAGFEALSGTPEERDLDRFRSLFHPEARGIPTGRPDGEAAYAVYSIEEYVAEFRKRYAGEPVDERLVHTVTERFGDIAHVWATYERRPSPDAEPDRRGIDSFQLWYDGDRWWIMHIIAHPEREGAPIPERYGG